LGTGVEWIVDAYGCDPDCLRNADLVRRICDQVIADLGLNVVGQPQLHRFCGPAGVTALYMLSESHLACHTYPEYGVATFNLYCCRERPEWNWNECLRREFQAVRVSTRQVIRGRNDGAVVESSPCGKHLGQPSEAGE
jgi:S-adenosylmethionine decarboxylase